MNVYSWPETWPIENCSIVLEPNVRGFASQYNNSYFAVDLLGEMFVMTGRIAIQAISEGGQYEATLNKLRGVHLFSMHHFARPVPVGTQRGSPTLGANAAQGASVLSLANLTVGGTFKAGDMIGVSNQLFQIADDVTFAASTGSVNTVNRIRTALVAGAGVVWDRPKANWRLRSPPPVSYEAAIMNPIDIELVETWLSV